MHGFLLLQCLFPVLACNGWSVTTVEGLGSTRSGLGRVQARLSGLHGTQCGFCTPGMVMAMDSLRRASDRGPDQAQAERLLDGNLCRCTGYRPIFDAFRSFAADAPGDLKDKVKDIEDLEEVACSKRGGTSFQCLRCRAWLSQARYERRH